MTDLSRGFANMERNEMAGLPEREEEPDMIVYMLAGWDLRDALRDVKGRRLAGMPFPRDPDELGLPPPAQRGAK